ncbi:MAG: hypothetical protein Q4G64_05205, partial [bacterium]|nr:hypothetical protein [bacterium]
GARNVARLARSTAEATPEPIEDPTAPATDPGTESHEIRPGEEPVGSEDFPTAGGDLFLADVEVSTGEVGRSAVFTFEGADTLDWEAEFVDEALQQGSGEPVDMGNAEQILKVTVSGLRYPEPGEDVISDVDASGAEDMTIVVDPPFEGMSVLFIGVTHTEFASIEVIEEEAQTLLSVTF